MILAIASGSRIAKVFGTCSPMIIWNVVIRKNESGNAIAWMVISLSPRWNILLSPINCCAIRGSPTRHKASDAIVTPSWHADRYLSMCSRISLINIAFLFPCWISTSIWEPLTFTRANSAATKNQLINTIRSTKNIEIIRSLLI